MPAHTDSRDLKDHLRDAVASGLREVLADEELTKRFWEQGYAQLQEHAVRNGSQWIGKRVITTIVAAIATAAIIWLVKSGAIK